MPIALPIMSDRLIMPTLPPMPGMSNGIAGRVLDLDLDLDVVHRVLDDALAEALAGRLAGVLADQRLEQPVHRRLARRLAHRLAAAVLLQPDRFLDQVAGDLLDVAADIADLGELGRLDLDERRVGQLGQPPADLGLAAARWARSSGCSWASPRRAARAPSRWRRQRLRSATATARLASAWPMMCSSSAATIALGVSRHDSSPLRRSGSGALAKIGSQMVSTVTRSLVNTQTSAATAIARRAIFSASSS